MNFIDKKFLNLISSRLQRFSTSGNDIYNFRCPYCGDSEKNKRKARGYLFENKTEMFFKCHNCGHASNFSSLLKYIDSTLWDQWKVERFFSNKRVAPSPPTITQTEHHKDWVKHKTSILSDCITLNNLPKDHPALEYISSRKIPESLFDDIFYCDDINSIIKHIPKYQNMKLKPMAAIVVPFYNKDNEYSYLQCRILNNDKMRFVTLEVEKGQKLYGSKYVNWDYPVYVLEGPIDSMFVKNSVALAGASHRTSLKYIKDHSKSKVVMLFDNDYKTNEVIKKLLVKCIDDGLDVVLYDDEFDGMKDMNDAIKSGWSVDKLNKYIDEHTYSPLKAKLILSSIK